MRFFPFLVECLFALQILEKRRLASMERRRKLIAGLPELFSRIHLLFQSNGRPVLTKQDLIHKLDIADTSKLVLLKSKNSSSCSAKQIYYDYCNRRGRGAAQIAARACFRVDLWEAFVEWGFTHMVHASLNVMHSSFLRFVWTYSFSCSVNNISSPEAMRTRLSEAIWNYAKAIAKQILCHFISIFVLFHP